MKYVKTFEQFEISLLHEWEVITEGLDIDKNTPLEKVFLDEVASKFKDEFKALGKNYTVAVKEDNVLDIEYQDEITGDKYYSIQDISRPDIDTYYHVYLKFDLDQTQLEKMYSKGSVASRKFGLSDEPSLPIKNLFIEGKFSFFVRDIELEGPEEISKLDFTELDIPVQGSLKGMSPLAEFARWVTDDIESMMDEIGHGTDKLIRRELDKYEEATREEEEGEELEDEELR